jgi:hypothetical protein
MHAILTAVFRPFLSNDGRFWPIKAINVLNGNHNVLSDLNNLGKDISHAYGLLFILTAVFRPFSSTDGRFWPIKAINVLNGSPNGLSDP